MASSSSSSSTGVRASSNPSIELKHLPGKGRALVWSPPRPPPGEASSSNTTCRAGTLLLAVDPIASVLDATQIDVRCAYCYRPAASAAIPTDGSGAKPAKLKRCKGCKTNRYCSVTCQRKDWEFVHDKECRALQAWGRAAALVGAPSDLGASQRQPQSQHAHQHVPSTRARLLSRLLWTKQLDAKQSNLASLRDLESHTTAKMQRPEEQSAILRLAQIVLRFAGMGLGHDDASPKVLGELGLSSLGDIIDLICQSHTNSFALTTGDQCAIGLAASPGIAMANHSCEPNAAHSFQLDGADVEGPGPMRLVAIRDIQEGEQITTAYVDVADGYERRRERLRRDYFFECGCMLCLRDGEREKSWTVPQAGASSSSKNSSGSSDRKQPPTADPRASLWCPHFPTCKGWVCRPPSTLAGPVTLRCSSCGAETRLSDVAALHARLAALQSRATAVLDQQVDSATATKEALRHWTSTVRPLLEDLARTMPPNSAPFFEVLQAAKHVLSLLFGRLEGKQVAAGGVTADDVLDAGARLAIMEVAAVGFAIDDDGGKGAKSGEERAMLYSRGHPGRAVLLCLAGRWLLSAAAATSSPATARTSSPLLSSALFLVEGPYVASSEGQTSGPAATAQLRAKWARLVLQEAEASARMGYGEDVEGGLVGRNAREALREMDAEGDVKQ